MVAVAMGMGRLLPLEVEEALGLVAGRVTVKVVAVMVTVKVMVV